MRVMRKLTKISNAKEKLVYKLITKNRFKDEFNLISQNSKYKDMHKGKRCFILGNGPSLNLEKLSLLEDEFVFSVNQISRHKEFKHIKPNYHFWADPVFFNITKDKPEDIELLASFKNVKTKENNPQCFFPIEAKGFIKEFNLDKELNVNYFKSRLMIYDNFDDEIEFDKLIPGYFTVVQWAISMAIYMGFKEIYLLGCDTTTIVTKINMALNMGESQYAYEVSQNEKKRMEKAINTHSMEVQMRVESEVLKGYRILNEVAAKKGIKMFNCSKTTIVDSIQRINFEQVISKKA